MNRHTEACRRTADTRLSSFVHRLERWADREDAQVRRPVLMREVARAAGWGGVVLTLRDASGGEVLVAASDTATRRVHELEVALAEGPTVEAARGSTSIAYGAELARRWPRFAGIAGQWGVQAAMAIPLDPSPGHVAGSLSAIGPPMPDQRGDLRGLQRVAEALDEGLLHSSNLVRDADTGTDLPGPEMFEPEECRPALHQAAGVLHERQGWTVDDAIAMIRAHAYAEDRSVAEVAVDVLAGHLWSA